MPSFRCALTTATIALSLAASGCHRHRTDEQILREKIDVTTVHLYVATKIAITRADSDPEVRAARAQIVRAVDAFDRLRGTSVAVQAGMPQPTHAALAPVPEAPPLDPRDVVRLASALWSLRSEGKRIVEEGREDRLPPVLPILLGAHGVPPEAAAVFDSNAEHSLLVSALLLAKLHPRVPTPIPDEIILYEASMSHPEALRIPVLAPIVRTARAYIYGTNELCDLAARDAAALSQMPRGTASQWNAALGQATGRTASLSDHETLATEGSFRVIAHGATAACYFGRHEPANARRELRLFLDDVEVLGIPPYQVAPLRAYLAFEDGDRAAAHTILVDARANPAVDAESRAEIDRMLTAVDANDASFVEHQYNRARVTALTVRFAIIALDRAGAFDAMRASPLVARAADFGGAASNTLAQTQRSAANLGGAGESARGCAARFHR